MATSGQVNSTTAGSGGRSYLYVKWRVTNTWNGADCGSNIRWELWLHNGNQWYSNSIRCDEIYINGVKVSDGGLWGNYLSSGDFKLDEGDTSVGHNNDGTKTFNINFTGWFFSNTNVSGSEDFTLDTIPRASSFTVSGTEIGSDVNVSINSSSNNFTHTVTLYFGSLTPEVKTNISTSTFFTPDLEDYASQIPNSMNGPATITVDTYNGGTKIGTTSQNITLTLPPDDVVPPEPTITLQEAVSGIANDIGAYVQNKSKINGSISAEGIYGSTITSYKVQINSGIYNSSTFTTSELFYSGTNHCIVEITDSRGQKTTKDVTYNVLAYQEPTITKFTAVRNSTTQTRIDCVLSVVIKPLTVNNVNKNTPHSIKIKLDNTDKYTNTTNYTLTNSSQSFTGASTTETHSVRLVLEDYFYNTTNGNPIIKEIPIGTAFALMNWSEDGLHMAIGQIYDTSLPVDLQVRESLAVGGMKAFYRDINGILATKTFKYVLDTIIKNNNTYDITFKRSGNVVTVTVVATIKANTSREESLQDLDFPEWAKNYNESGVVNYSSASTIISDCYANLILRKTTSNILKYVLFYEYANNSSEDKTLRTTMTYIIED